MSRDVRGKVKITGKLVAHTPIAVGGMGGGEQVDLDIAVDGQGRYYIPGSSLTGPMRAWATASLESVGNNIEDILDKLFGYIGERQNTGQASALFVEDAFPVEVNPDILRTLRERRHGISIDACTGTTKKGFLYTRALLPRGMAFRLEMELDLTPGDAEHTEALRHILDALARGEIRFGANKTRGFGVLCLEEFQVDRYDFADVSDLDRWLRDEPANGRGLDALREPSTTRLKSLQRYDVSIEWRPTSGIMVKAGKDGSETKMLPLVSGTGRGLTPVIPGASLKGVLRAQAGKILRTLFNDECKDVVDDLFGSTERGGRLHVDDVYYEVAQPLSYPEWLGENPEALDRISTRREHVAIDRFTGGASDGALYSARPVKCSEEEPLEKWTPIKISVDFSNPAPQPSIDSNIELALLKLLIRDLQEGYIPVGFGTRRGLGEIGVDKVTWTPCPDEPNIQEAWQAFIRGRREV
ncbi:MAG: RAMP superfamily CRISPR-associated protein [Synergistaceae bacterium]|jgi:CRISPR/Cas system CSM-associated protein Csm3 (group 7 of RAMP superfamily)|nr:RAMP superfamily CRISPR-associated protein [Synergistaceae bacterium]